MTTTICLYWYFVWLSLFSLARLRPTALGYLRAFTTCFVKSILSLFLYALLDLAHEYDLHRHTHTHFLPPFVCCQRGDLQCNTDCVCVLKKPPLSMLFTMWYSLEHTTRSFPSRNIAFGSCTCFEEQFLSCDSLRPIRTLWILHSLFWACWISMTPSRCSLRARTFCMQALRHQPNRYTLFPLPPITKHWIGRCFASPVVNQYVLYCMSIGSGVTMAHVW